MALRALFPWITAARIACLGLILFIVGNELESAAARQVFEVLAGVFAAAGLVFERVKNGL